MRRIVVVKLTRLGDLIEAAPLINDIREQEPGAHLTLVVNESFREAAELLAGVDQVVSFPLFAYAHALREGAQDFRSLFHWLEGFLSSLSELPCDLALNVTNSQLSGHLMGFLSARQKRGLWYDPCGRRQVEGALIRFFGPNEGMRRYGPFNLSDFMRLLYGIPQGPASPRLQVRLEAEVEAARLLTVEGQDVSWVGVQLGASEPCKRWRIPLFGQAIEALLERSPARVVLLGSPDEIPLAEALLSGLSASASRVLNLVGQTALHTLAAVTRRLSVLLTNDTGTMHLAAAFHVPVVNLSLGSAWFRETGPYGAGHLILEPRIACRPCDFSSQCHHGRCKALIPPQAVAQLLDMVLRGERVTPETLPDLGACDLYQTTFDPDGLLDYACLTPHPLRVDEVLLHLYRAVLLQAELGGAWEERRATGHRLLARDACGLEPSATQRLLQVLEVCRHLQRLAEDGLAHMERAEAREEEEDDTRLEALVEASDTARRMIAEVGRRWVECRLPIRAFLLEWESARGASRGQLIRAYRGAWQRLCSILGWMLELLASFLQGFGVAPDQLLNPPGENPVWQPSVAEGSGEEAEGGSGLPGLGFGATGVD